MHLNKQNKKTTRTKFNTKILNLADILVSNNLIFNYSKNRGYISVSLKPYFLISRPMIESIKSYSNSNKITPISYTKLYELTTKNPTSLYILYTVSGITDHKKALEKRVGGTLFYKIN